MSDMKTIVAACTLVVGEAGKPRNVAPGEECEIDAEEADRLVSIGAAEHAKPKPKAEAKAKAEAEAKAKAEAEAKAKP